MKIYTKTGDLGETGLMGGSRLGKDSLRIQAIGDIDELNAVIGVCRADSDSPRLDLLLHGIQQQLFGLGADLATPLNSPIEVPRVTEDQVSALEKQIDELTAKLEPLTNFILPGGNAYAARLHLARTMCRRAERSVVALHHNEDIGVLVIQYINRLSDLLFTMARYANKLRGTPEEKWMAHD